MRIKIKLLNKLIFVLLILWAIVIFYFSHQPADKSNEISRGISNSIVENFNGVDKIDVNINIRYLNHFIRKFSHFGEYTILGILMYLASTKSNIPKKNKVAWCVLLCVFYAIADEIHQAFIPGRGPKVFDVIIDTGGSMLGILIAKLYVK